jgi:DNA-binding NarL/FixJ family response regulator
MSDLSVLLATDRPAIHAFFRGLWRPLDGRPPISQIPITAGALAGYADELARATIAIVDVGSGPTAAIELCQELRRQRPGLPTIALVCCPHALTSWELQALAAACDSALDLHGAQDELRRALQSVARGNVVLRIDLGRDGRMLWGGMGGTSHREPGRRATPPPSETDAQIIDMVARGMSDREIARQLHLSPHTVGHHVDRLCTRVGAKNRIALAAWAGRHGFYHSPTANGAAHPALLPI